MLALDDEERVEDSHPAVKLEGEEPGSARVGAREFKPVRGHIEPSN